jgi:hypothetical protein
MSGLQEFFDSFNDSEELTCKSFEVCWSRNGIGFGSFYVYKDEDGVLHVDNECMSREFVKGVMCKLIDNAVFDDEGR